MASDGTASDDTAGAQGDAAPPRRHLRTPFDRALLLCKELTVRPEWIDYNDHMNVGYYLLAFEEALDEAYDHWLGIGGDYVRETGMGPFALQSNMHYLRELRLGERVLTYFQLLDLDAKRWHYMLTMVKAETGELAATAEQLSMNVDHATRRSAPLAPDRHARLAELLEAQSALPRPPQLGRPIGIRRP